MFTERKKRSEKDIDTSTNTFEILYNDDGDNKHEDKCEHEDNYEIFNVAEDKEVKVSEEIEKSGLIRELFNHEITRLKKVTSGKDDIHEEEEIYTHEQT